MTASVRVLSTSSVDSSPSILFIAPNGSKVLVNCGEGCQRLFLEHSQKISTVKAVCLTHLANETIGGLPGMILTTADAANISALASGSAAGTSRKPNLSHQSTGTTGSSSRHRPQHEQVKPHTQQQHSESDMSVHQALDILGPQGTQTFINSLRHFMRRDKFHISVHEGSIDDFTSSNREQRKKKKSNPSATDDDPNFFTIHSIAFNVDEIESHSFDLEGKKRKISDSISKQALSFVVHTPPVQGKFLIEKAIELGIPKGSLYGQLKAGKAVSFKDKDGNIKTVESKQVVTPSTPSVSVLILYYPTSFVADQIFISHWNRIQSSLKDSSLDLVVHMTTYNLFNEYGQSRWTLLDFPTTEHLLLSTNFNSSDTTPFQSATAGAIYRAQICDEIYLRINTSTFDYKKDVKSFREAVPLVEYNLLPRSRKGFNETQTVQQQQDNDSIRATMAETGALELSADILKHYPLQTTCYDQEANLIFTGTGSAIPCKHRNVTGIVLKQIDGRMMLLDIGEGTIGQLVRCQQLLYDEILRNIKAVWISHPHADHHLGLLRLLHDRKSTDRLLLIAPAPLFRFLEEYSLFDNSIRNSYDPIDCKNLVNNQLEFQNRLRIQMGIGSCISIPVQHCANAFACVLDETDFGRLVYSGDCRPCYALAEAAKGADILIHESTFEDGMESDAILKRHCTIGEALEVARRMEAKCTVLTHFSQRYPKIPPLPVSSKMCESSPVIFAFDFMRLKPSNLLIASKLTPALRLLYPEVDVKDEKSPTQAEVVMSVPGIFANADLL